MHSVFFIASCRCRGLLYAVFLLGLSFHLSGCCCFTFGDDKDEESTDPNPIKISEVMEALKAPTTDPGVQEAPAAPKEAKPERATVHAVWFSHSPVNGPSGGTSPVTVRVEPTPGGKPGVAVMEQYADGTGDMWQSSAWIAAFNASRMTGYALGDHEFTVKSSGSIDGPSAGMLLTATMMALIRGDVIRQDTTMTGAVNPDGSAGPVGGIIQKMGGAKAAGKLRFGYPMGTRMTFDLATKQQADVVEHAKVLGMEVVEIKDVRDAYALLTDKALLKRDVTEAQMALGPVAEAPIKRRIAEMMVEVESRAKTILSSSQFGRPAITKALRPLVQAWVETVAEAKSLAAQNSFALATLRLRQSLAYLHMINDSAILYDLLLDGNHNAIVGLVNESTKQLDEGIEALRVLIYDSSGTKTLGGQLNAINALITYVNVLYAWQSAAEAMDAISQELSALQSGTEQGSKIAYDQVFFKFQKPLQERAIAKAQMEVVADQLRIDQQEEGALLVATPKKMKSLSSAYASASNAGLYVVDALKVDDMAKEYNMPKEAFAKAFERFDPAYGLAKLSQEIAKIQDKDYSKLGEEKATMLQLAAGANAYNLTAELVNKYYSLNMDSKTQTVDRPEVLLLQLESARQQARASAGACRAKTGFIPSSARFYYQLALELASGKTDADRLKALNNFWLSSFWSELAMNLGI